MTAPGSHLLESQKLEADGLADLYEVIFKTTPVTRVYFRNGPTISWQSKTFEQMAVKLTGDGRTADGSETRPKLTVVNPFGAFNQAAMDGVFDYATVIRYRVLQADLLANINIFERRMWYISRVPEMIANQAISFELRNMTEGANFMIPVRMFMPPDFPLVTL